jgi:antitoxin MazE
MRTKLVAIGNSKGIRLPKALIAAAGLEDSVTLRVADGKLIIASARRRRKPREGWAAAIDAEIRKHGAPEIDPSWEGLSNEWDETQWQ